MQSEARFGRHELGLYAATVAAWSLSWYALSINMATGIPAPVSTTWRFGMASAIMFVWVWTSGGALVFPLRRHLQFMLLGMLLFSTNFILFYVGSLYVVSGLLAVVFSLASIVNLGIAAVRGDRAGPRRWFGATLGVCGVAMLYGRELLGDASALVGLAFCVSGTLSFCLGNLVSQSLQGQSVPVLSASAWGMLYGMVWSAVLVVAFGYEFQFDWSFSYVGSMIFLVLVSTILAFWAYLNLIGRIGAGRAAYATVMFPIGALLLSTFVEGWQWTPLAIAGLALALAGNVFVLRGGRHADRVSTS
jgi:drug/metabolite transporter (DMT)-like permease